MSEKYASCPQEGKYVFIEYDPKLDRFIGNITIQNKLNDKYILAKVYENSELKFLKANPSISVIPPLKINNIQVTTSNYLIKENPSIKFQIICIPIDGYLTDPNEIKKVYNSIDYKKIGQKINIEGKYKDNTPSIVSSFNEQKKSNNSFITSQSNYDFESLNNKVTDLKKKIQEMEEKIKISLEKLQELYSKSVGLKEENNDKNENEKNNTSTLYKLIKNKYSEIFTLIAVLCSFILGASINRLK